MNNLYRNVGLVVVFLYILGIFAVGYYTLHNAVEAGELIKKMPLLGTLVVITTLLGLVAFMFLFLGASTQTLQDEDKTTEVENNNTNNAQNQNISTENKNTQLKHTLENIFWDTNISRTQLLDKVLKTLCQQLEISIGVIYTKITENGENFLEISGNYALYQTENHIARYSIGEGLVGQVAKNGKTIVIDDVPGDYLSVVSGLGKAKPACLLIYPVQTTENEILGVLEFASFKIFTDENIKLIEEVGMLLAKELETNKV